MSEENDFNWISLCPDEVILSGFHDVRMLFLISLPCMVLAVWQIGSL